MGSTRPTGASRRARADGPAGACPPRARSAGQRDAVGCFRRRFRVRGGFMIRQSVIFDVGKVLFDWDLRHLFAKLIDDPAELEWFVGHVVTPEWHFQHDAGRSEEHTSELQSLMRISYAVFCLKKKRKN